MISPGREAPLLARIGSAPLTFAAGGDDARRKDRDALCARRASVESRRVGIDYHVEVEADFYSVPYRFARHEVEVRLTLRSVEISHKGERIAAHLRYSGNHQHTTVPITCRRASALCRLDRRAHPQEAAAIGPATAALCELILERRPHPEQGFRCLSRHCRLVRPSAPNVSGGGSAPSRSAP